MSDNLLSVTEFCQKHGMDGGNLRRALAAGRIPSAFKVGKQWVIPADVKPPEDKRVTSGKYVGWRQKGKKGAE